VIGKSLKEKREALEISLEEASARTHIKLEFLQALEEETFYSLPDPVYLTGFLRRYAHFLGLDADALVQEFQAQVSEAMSVRIEPSKRESPSVRKKWSRPSLLIVALLLIPTAYFLSLNAISHRASKGNLVTPRAKVSEGPLFPPGERTKPQRSSPEAVKEAAPSAKGEWHTLVISARERTWLMIQADEGQSREILLLEGQTISLAARKGFLVTIGNAGGVRIVLDGEEVPLAGTSGQVIRDLMLPGKR
jgi:cytoskeletal protein RodZ